jgi:hypothetical protein
MARRTWLRSLLERLSSSQRRSADQRPPEAKPISLKPAIPDRRRCRRRAATVIFARSYEPGAIAEGAAQRRWLGAAASKARPPALEYATNRRCLQALAPYRSVLPQWECTTAVSVRGRKERQNTHCGFGTRRPFHHSTRPGRRRVSRLAVTPTDAKPPFEKPSTVFFRRANARLIISLSTSLRHRPACCSSRARHASRR